MVSPQLPHGFFKRHFRARKYCPRAALWILFSLATVQNVGAERSQDLAGVQILERTGALTLVYFSSTDKRLTQRLESLTASVNDFSVSAAEWYDVFWSDSAGQEDPHGDFLTIEGQYFGKGNDLGGGNIAQVDLLLKDGRHVGADRVIGYTLGSIGADRSSVENAADSSPHTAAVLGTTKSTNERFRITVGFPPTQPLKPSASPAPASERPTPSVPELVPKVSTLVPIGLIGKPAQTHELEFPPEFAPQQLLQMETGSEVSILAFSQKSQEVGIAEMKFLKPSVALSLSVLRFPNPNPVKFFSYRATPAAQSKLWAIQLDADGAASKIFEVVWIESEPALRELAAIADAIEAETEVLIGEFDSSFGRDLAIINPTQRTASLYGVPDIGPFSMLATFTAAELPGKLTAQVVNANFDAIDDLWLVFDLGFSQFVIGRNGAEPLALGWSTEFLALGLHAQLFPAYTHAGLGQGMIAVDRTGGFDRVHLVDGTSMRFSRIRFNSLVTSTTRQIYGDFNGDGTRDLLAFPENGRQWIGAIFTGHYRQNASLALPPPAEGDSYFVFDVNSDRIDELLIVAKSAAPDAATLRVFSISSRDNAPRAFNKALASPLAVLFPKNQRSDVPDIQPLPSAAREAESRVFVTPSVETAARPCIAYNPNSYREWGPSFDLCPNDFAWMFVDDASTSEQNPELMRVDGTCCPLPGSDMLTAKTTFTSTVCPEESVVTGGVFSEPGNIRSLQFLRCTQINSAKYQLAKARPGVYWGLGYSGMKNSERKSKHQIPQALRLAAGRLSRNTWDLDGCAGQPWGSLFTGRTGPECDKLLFAVIERKPHDGNVARAVEVYPSCTRPPDPFDPLGGC